MEVSSEVKRVELSVRDLVEFAERSGDIDNRTAHTDPDAMQEGARLHRKIQKEQGAGYSAEVTLKFEKQEEELAKLNGNASKNTQQNEASAGSTLPPELLAKFDSIRESMLTNSENK